MSIFITAIYRGLLSSPTLSPSAQEQILRYAVESKEYELIELLLENPNLTKAMDAAIGEVSASRVKAAWLRRPGRSVAELEKLVGTYSTQSVLLDLVRTPDMPSEIYLAVVNKTTKRAVLVEIATASHIDKSVQAAAVSRLAEVLPADVNLNKQSVLIEFYPLIQRHPELAESISSTTKNLPMALAALGFGDLSPESESKVLEMATEALAKYISDTTAARKAKSSNPTLHIIFSVPLLDELSLTLSQKAGFDEAAIGKILKLVQPLNKALEKYNKDNQITYFSGTSFDKSIELLKKAYAPRKVAKGYNVSNGREKLLADLKNCSSSAELEKIVADVCNMRNKVDLDYALKDALLNKYLNAEILETANWGFSSHKILNEFLEALSKTNKWYLWVARDTWRVTDEELGMAADPKSTLVALSEDPNLDNEYALQSLVDSKYLTSDVIPEVRATIFTAPKVPAQVSGDLDGLLTSKLLTSNDWQAFESMVEDYKGPIGDLLAVISQN